MFGFAKLVGLFRNHNPATLARVSVSIQSVSVNISTNGNCASPLPIAKSAPRNRHALRR